jgi:hypothetical protein
MRQEHIHEGDQVKRYEIILILFGVFLAGYLVGIWTPDDWLNQCVIGCEK